jgi:ectoine hydroxylase-related dioxygenase (phytanoyl-CoA dioxygenase family)
MAVVLDDRQIDHFHTHGFLRLEAITTAEEVTELQGVYDRLFDPDGPVADGDRVALAAGETLPQIMNPDRYAPELRETTAYENALALATQLLGPETYDAGMHAIRKPAYDGVPTPWHQDEAYWSPEFEHSALSIWIPLQPATLENGCMQFVPGSQHLGIQPHRRIDADSHGLELVSLEHVEGAVACPLPPGGATVHFCRTLHYTGPNTTDEPRRALIMGFNGATTRLERPKHMPWQVS